jgi:hypothetical protein
MPLTFLLTQSIPGWHLTTASESVVIFKPLETIDPTASIEFVPREDDKLKTMALLKGKGLPLNGQDLVFQRTIKPKDYLSMAASMHEIVSMDLEGFDL